MDNNRVFIVPCIVMVSVPVRTCHLNLPQLITAECTYDQPSNRKRIPDIRRVENKLKCAEMVLQSIMPGVDIFNPSFDIQRFLDKAKAARLEETANPNSPYTALKIAQKGINSMLAMKDRNNEIDEETGLPKGSVRKMRPQGRNSGLSDSMDGSIYSPQSNMASPQDGGREIKIILPPKHVASELIEAVWDNACVLFRFYHRPSFIRDLDLLYETDPDDYTNKQYKILPLVYSVMAVGVLFSMDKCEKLGFKDASEGYKYFVAARKLIDIADARDTYAIQSIVMMIIFLQCSARLSTCYSYIGVALRSALRAGLHRKVAYNFNPIELETRRRLFWTIRKMDIYVNAMLGLPRSTAESDFDQEMPEEIDDENITEDAYFPQERGKISSAGIANAHTRLITILSHIMKYIYPVKQDEIAAKNSTPLYNVTHSKVSEMETEIRAWLESLPSELRPGANPPPEYLKANRLLHLALCHVQIVLYRPFIHYCSPKFKRDEKARVSALNCIGVSRRAMYLAHELTSQNLLNGAYWFSIYTIFFSVACLVFYVHENPNDPEALDIRRDAELGKNALTSLKDSSMAAQRTYNLLNTLFEQLNRRTAKMPGSVHDSNISATDTAGSTPIDHQSEFGAAAAGATESPDPSIPDTKLGAGTANASYSSDTKSPPAKRGRKSKKSSTSRTNSSMGGNKDRPFNPSFGVTATAAAESANGFPELSGVGSSSKHQVNSTNDVSAMSTPSSDIQNGRKTESPHFYVPGIMDQVDAQLFGRFLPPYMLQQQHPSGEPQPHPGINAGSGYVGGEGNLDNAGFDWESSGNGESDMFPSSSSLQMNEGSWNGAANTNTHNSNNNNSSSNNNNNNNNSLFHNNKTASAAENDMHALLHGNDGTSGNGNTPATMGHEFNLEYGGGSSKEGITKDGEVPGTNADDADDGRRFSLSSLFTGGKDWEELLAQHNELSGLNSFMTQ